MEVTCSSSIQVQKGAQAPLVVSIIIPVYNQSHHTQKCLKSVCDFPPGVSWEIIVVDDGSTDDTVSVVAHWAQLNPHIRLVANSHSHCFASACNSGAEAASGNYILFLNNDIEVLGGWFDPLFTALNLRPEIGIAAPKLLFPDGTIQHCGKTMERDSCGLSVFKHLLYEQPDGTPGSFGGEFPTVTGACMLVRKHEFFEYGPFDERYLNGWEDDDLCLSFYSNGLRALVCAESRMIHYQGGTLRAEAALIERYLTVMRKKGFQLASDDPFFLALIKRIKFISKHFNETFENNRTLFHSKWLLLIEQLHHIPDKATQDLNTTDRSVTIIIVTYNSEKTIRPCLDSLLSTLRAGDVAVVVDNASKDQTANILKSYTDRDSRLICHQNSINRGYGAAVNQGLDLATTPFVVFLNPDTVVTFNWLDRLLNHCANPKVVAVGPVSNYAAGWQSVDRHWQGPLPDGISPDQASALLYGWNFKTSLQTDLLIGFCMLIRREPLLALGSLDERLFIGNDDLELSWRLRMHEYELRVARDVFVYHEGQHSFRTETTGTTNRYLQESSDFLYRILEDHYGPGRVPEPIHLWGIDWFRPSQAVFNPYILPHQVLTLPLAVRLLEPSSVPLVSIIILTFNQLTYTRKCIDALLKHTKQPIQIIFVDNGSNDGTAPWLQFLAAQDRRMELLLNSENLGFAAGCNQGINKAIGRYIVLLNNDVLVTPEWLSGLLECHTSMPGVGIVGPMTNSASGIQVLNEPDYEKAGNIDLFALQFRARNRFRRIPSRRIVGFCMLFERELCDAIGLLDEAFGNGNYEDDDYCLRAAIAGYSNVIAGDVFVHHYGGVSFRGANIDYRKSLAKNRGLFREKWSKPVTDKALAERIALYKAKEELVRLQLEERDSEAEELLKRFNREFPHSYELGELYASMKSDLYGNYSDRDPGAGLPYLKRAKGAYKAGEYDYAKALVLKSFMLEPWRPELISAIQGLPENSTHEIASIVEDAILLYPDSRGLARLRVILSLDNPVSALAAAEHYILSFGVDDAVLEMGLKLRRSIGNYNPESIPGRSVSLCMIVRNEEHCIARCIASFKPIVHEIVIVDTGSDDRTQQIAHLFGANVIAQAWSGDFSAARNKSLEAAKSDWILVMDADEVISKSEIDLFAQVLNTNQAPVAFLITTRNYTNNKNLDGFKPCNGEYPENEKGIGWTPSTKTRLFPNNMNILFEGVVHELVDPSIANIKIPTVQHPVVVHHYGGLEESRVQSKREFYFSLGLKKLNSGNGSDLKALYELAIQAAELSLLDKASELWQKFLEQEVNFAPAWFNFGYVLLKKGMLDESWKANEHALRIDPEYNAAHINRALCAFCRLASEQAEQVIKKELRRAADDVTLLILTELCKGSHEEAVAGLRLIVRQGYNVSMFILETATIMELVGRQDKTEFLIKVLREILVS